jgi:hypothetical protein
MYFSSSLGINTSTASNNIKPFAFIIRNLEVNKTFPTNTSLKVATSISSPGKSYVILVLNDSHLIHRYNHQFQSLFSFFNLFWILSFCKFKSTLLYCFNLFGCWSFILTPNISHWVKPCSLQCHRLSLSC